MRRSRILTVFALLSVAATAAAAHDMFFRLTHYFVASGDKVRAPLLNGTFSKSENSISPLIWYTVTPEGLPSLSLTESTVTAGFCGSDPRITVHFCVASGH